MPPHVFSNMELMDMVLVYGETRQNGLAASRLYAQRFPTRHHPNSATFNAVVQRGRDYGNLRSNSGRDGGRKRSQRILKAKEQVLDIVEENPRMSTRQIARQVPGLSQSSAWRLLHDATGPHAASDTSEIEYTDSEDDTEDELPETAPIDSLNPPAPKNVTNGWQGDELEKRMDEAYKILQCSVQKTKTKKDELDIYGQLVTEKLRKMDEETRDFARNKIDNMLFDLKRNHPFRNLSTQNTRTTASSSPSTSQQSFHQVFSSPPTSQLIQTSSSSSIK